MKEKYGQPTIEITSLGKLDVIMASDDYFNPLWAEDFSEELEG